MPDLVSKVIAEWQTSEAPLVQQAYGEITALSGLVRPELDWPQEGIRRIVAEGPEYARKGAAYAAANLWSQQGSSYGPGASALLRQLIPVAGEKTWSAIFDLFRMIDEIEPEDHWQTFLSVLADHISDAGSQESSFVVERLQTLLPHCAGLIGRIAISLVAIWRSDLADMRTATSSSAPDLVDIAVTLHRLGPETRDLGTELFEALLDLNAYSARATLDQIDNRFRNVPGNRMPRLKRRVRGGRPRKRISSE